ncbi:hypothetical protein MRB56_08730 [Halomonas cupida]|uniref:hypothetical protein n=1 Tax=Halomonas cupida TaxID=44933 RepID=UPI0039B6063B
MSLEFFISTIVAVSVAVVGWVTGHKLNGNRDIRNKQRELRVRYLTDAYHTFMELGRNVDILKNYKDVEKAIYFLHLFGTPKLIELCNSFVEDLTTTNKSNQTEMVLEIRDLIRDELGLEQVDRQFKLLKITPKNEIRKNET